MWDLIVIGSGPAGHTAALKAAEFSKKVLVIDKDELGGTCLNKGCIPTKSLLSLAAKGEDNLYDKTKKVVDRLKSSIEFLFKKSNITFIKGAAKLIDSNIVEVNNEKYKGEKIILALGSKPVVPKIKGIEYSVYSNYILESDDFLKYEDILIIGAGVIGIEIAQLLCSLDKKVRIIEAQSTILSTFDADISSTIKKQLPADIKLNSLVTKIEKKENKYLVHTDKDTYEADLVLTAIGRIAATDSFDPSSLIIKEKSLIKVDENFKTNIDNIYAIGDCIKGYQLAHYASSCAHNLIINLYNKDKGIKLNLEKTPACVYTHNEIASVGDLNQSIVVKHFMIANPKVLTSNDSRSLIKLAFNEEGYIKGASMLCARASDLIMIITMAINNNLHIDQMLKDIYPHPSYSESIYSALLEAKEILDKRSL